MSDVLTASASTPDAPGMRLTLHPSGAVTLTMPAGDVLTVVGASFSDSVRRFGLTLDRIELVQVAA